MSATTVYLGLGSNLGDRLANLRAALSELAPEVGVDAVSSLYETDPVGPQDQPLFYNAACRGVTALSPRELLDHVKAGERAIGREPGPRWGPRLIDIDILLYGDEVVDEGGLVVPHPELAKRPFVLTPLADIARDVEHPILRETISELAVACGDAGVRVLAQRGWERDEV